MGSDFYWQTILYFLEHLTPSHKELQPTREAGLKNSGFWLAIPHFSFWYGLCCGPNKETTLQNLKLIRSLLLMLSNISSWPGEFCSARDCFFVPIHFNPSCISSHCQAQFKSSTFTLFDSRQLLINCNHAVMLRYVACKEKFRFAK